MHISQAKQAEKFYRIPMATHRALVADEQLGKGHALTLMKLASYLWSEEPIEGSRSDWAAVLGIGAQTFETHIPALGRAGCLSYIQPHVGYYRFLSFARSDSEAEMLRKLWTQAKGEFEHARCQPRERFVWITNRVEALRITLQASKFTLDEALKFTLPVVDTTTTSSLIVIENGGEQALKFTLDESKLTLPPEQASKVTFDAGIAAVVALYEQEIGGTLTAMMLDEFNDLWTQCPDLERWRYAFKASIGKRSRWAYTKAIIEHPERDQQGEKGNGNHADGGRTGAGARGKAKGNGARGGQSVAGSVSHDIDAWFGDVPAVQ
jgi:hypothetical protein